MRERSGDRSRWLALGLVLLVLFVLLFLGILFLAGEALDTLAPFDELRNS